MTKRTKIKKKIRKPMTLYNHKKDYLGQKKTIQLSYDKGMKI